jgi:hypothetical protein
MAKKANKAGGKLGDFAEELGTFLGTTERKATELLGQREQVAARLSAIRDKADQLLRDLSSGAADMAAAAGFARGMRPKSAAKRKVGTPAAGRSKKQPARKSAAGKRKTAKKTARKTTRTSGGGSVNKS